MTVRICSANIYFARGVVGGGGGWGYWGSVTTVPDDHDLIIYTAEQTLIVKYWNFQLDYRFP